eukprot:c12359_g1_i5.p1 GENE.c12359_g1_i5~~c12359_g1_i5.p1  ORF type:complete len:215 (+),score=36.63 c12359_g1_i5:26-646(+)
MSGSQGASLNEATPLVPPEQKTKENFNRHNVILSLIVVTIVGFSESIWASGMIVAFINIMTGKNEYVGYAEATTGIAQLVTALPVGYLADKYSRSLVIKLSSVLFVIGGGATGFAVIHGAMGHSEASFVILLMSLAIWGLVDGVISGDLTKSKNPASYSSYVLSHLMHVQAHCKHSLRTAFLKEIEASTTCCCFPVTSSVRVLDQH